MPVQMFSKKEQRWVEDRPVPYPPYFWEYFYHFFRCTLKLDPMITCRICEQRKYREWRDYHNGEHQ